MQRLQRQEQRLWQFGPTKPLPRRTLSWFAKLWLARNAVSQNEESDVVLSLCGEHVTGVRAKCDGLDGEARFLKNLSRGTLFDGFTELQVPARQSPGSGAVRADAFAEQDKTIPKNDDTDTNSRGTLFHCGVRMRHNMFLRRIRHASTLCEVLYGTRLRRLAKLAQPRRWRPNLLDIRFAI
jgi:hypothetical protein